jgi:hypothetical protein
MANSWKKYGGIYNSDKYNNIGVGTMVADKVLIRQQVITSSQVNGSLTVGKNVGIRDYLYVGKDTSISGELIVDKSEYIGDKLYFNRLKDVSNNYISFIAGNSKLGTLGIGTTNPTSFLDINVSNQGDTNSGIGGSTTGSTITDVFAIRNSNNKIRNIIAQNLHKSGVVVDTIGNIASIGFYKGNVDVSNAIPTINLTADTTNGIFTINGQTNKIVSNATTISSETITNISSNTNTTIFSKNNTDISSNLSTSFSSGDKTIITSYNDISINTNANTLINTVNNLTITTGNVSKINSIVSISKRATNDPLLNGTLTIYDNSADVFLIDYYKQNSVKAGNAVTIVTNDNSSNAFINIVNPSKKGFSIGGGAYPRDTSRSMGTIGITPTDASYIPAQVIVANNNVDKQRISVGINTYSPETSRYVMDINGPTRIGNGEMHIRYRNNFQQNSTHVSKQNPNFGVIIGSPYRRTGGVTGDFAYNFIYTVDGGVNWIPSYFGTNEFQTTIQYDRLYAYALNASEFFYIGSINSARIGYVKINTSLNMTRFGYSFDDIKFNTVYAFNNGSNYKILIGGTNTSNNPVIYYYNLNEITTANLQNSRSEMNALCSIIAHSDGSNNIAYFVGNGIQKVDFSSSTPISVSYKNEGTIYNRVYAYDASYVVATGTSIISYTQDGNNWSNVTNINNFNAFSQDSIKYQYLGYNITTYSEFSITNIVLIDKMNGIATGTFTNSSNTYPLIIYTTDGSITWNRINPKHFYSSGVGHYIENTTLSCIVPTTTNNFVLVNNTTNSTADFIPGSSDIIYGYLPNIFNVYSNQVVDVNGGLNVDGKIWQF